jgi:hypothetical protein
VSAAASPIPREFLGLARAFCAEVGCETPAVTAGWDAIQRQLETRYARGKATVRPEMAADLKQQWAALPGRFRFSTSASSKKSGLTLVEMRLSKDQVWAEHWEEKSWGIAIIACSMSLNRHGLIAMTWPIALIPSHALARWFQRQRPDHRDEGKLMADLSCLITASTDEALGNCGTRIVCPSGFWLGNPAMVEVRQSIEPTENEEPERLPALHIRTFISAEMESDQVKAELEEAKKV